MQRRFKKSIRHGTTHNTRRTQQCASGEAIIAANRTTAEGQQTKAEVNRLQNEKRTDLNKQPFEMNQCVSSKTFLQRAMSARMQYTRYTFPRHVYFTSARLTVICSFFFFLAKRSLCSVVFTNNRAKNAEQPNMRTSWSVHGNIGCLQNTRRAVDGAVSFEKQYKKILKTYLCHTIRWRRDEESEKQNSHDAVEARSFHVVVVVKTERQTKHRKVNIKCI